MEWDQSVIIMSSKKGVKSDGIFRTHMTPYSSFDILAILEDICRSRSFELCSEMGHQLIPYIRYGVGVLRPGNGRHNANPPKALRTIPRRSIPEEYLGKIYKLFPNFWHHSLVIHVDCIPEGVHLNVLGRTQFTVDFVKLKSSQISHKI